MTSWGGRREGAGRKRIVGRRRRVAHAKRAQFASLTPVHVTVRVIDGLPTLRSLRAARALKSAFLAGRERGDFRLVHFSVMSNHLHFVVEANDSCALSRGMQGLLVRIAHHLNSALSRSGRVDPFSSAAWFDGWRDLAPPTRPSPVAAPRTRQLRRGAWPHGRLGSGAAPLHGDVARNPLVAAAPNTPPASGIHAWKKIGRASCRERV